MKFITKIFTEFKEFVRSKGFGPDKHHAGTGLSIAKEAGVPGRF
jgi:hypothetical protein